MTRLLAVSLSVCAMTACNAPTDAKVLLALPQFSSANLTGLRAPSATLDVVDAKGKALVVDVDTGDKTVSVTAPVPMPCVDGACSLHVQLHASDAQFRLRLESADRCATRAEVAEFSSDLIKLDPYESVDVDLAHQKLAFDDDGDGIPNILEDAVCGRFDDKDGAVPPQTCSDANDPCCQGVSPLEGHETAFAGGPHTRADGSSVDVAPFALDGTEVTWLQFARCVAAGACLANEPQNPVRAKLAAGVNVDEPVVGLVPKDAEALCEFEGKRLPTDDEWDFAAAHRDAPGGPARGKYPWDDDAAAVSCRTDAAAVAANFSIPGTACAAKPVAVGSFASSNVSRGAGPGLADLGGNVAEWTLVNGNTAPHVADVPDGVDVVVLRGGGALSPLALLENDLPVRAAYPGDPAAWSATIERLATTAGFRCARSVDDGTVAPVFADEPACGAP